MRKPTYPKKQAEADLRMAIQCYWKAYQDYKADGSERCASVAFQMALGANRRLVREQLALRRPCGPSQRERR